MRGRIVGQIVAVVLLNLFTPWLFLFGDSCISGFYYPSHTSRSDLESVTKPSRHSWKPHARALSFLWGHCISTSGSAWRGFQNSASNKDLTTNSRAGLMSARFLNYSNNARDYKILWGGINYGLVHSRDLFGVIDGRGECRAAESSLLPIQRAGQMSDEDSVHCSCN